METQNCDTIIRGHVHASVYLRVLCAPCLYDDMKVGVTGHVSRLIVYILIQVSRRDHGEAQDRRDLPSNGSPILQSHAGLTAC